MQGTSRGVAKGSQNFVHHKNQPSVALTSSWAEPQFVDPKSSQLATRLRHDSELRYSLERDVAGEIAQQLIRLRRYRGLTQKSLAEEANTAQPAVARHESASSNMRCSSLEALLKALGGVVRVELIPEEHDFLLHELPRWWNILDAMARSPVSEATYSYSIRVSIPQHEFREQRDLPNAAFQAPMSADVEFASWFTRT